MKKCFPRFISISFPVAIPPSPHRSLEPGFDLESRNLPMPIVIIINALIVIIINAITIIVINAIIMVIIITNIENTLRKNLAQVSIALSLKATSILGIGHCIIIILGIVLLIVFKEAGARHCVFVSAQKLVQLYTRLCLQTLHTMYEYCIQPLCTLYTRCIQQYAQLYPARPIVVSRATDC